MSDTPLFDSDRMIIAALAKLLEGGSVTLTDQECKAAGDKAILVYHGAPPTISVVPKADAYGDPNWVKRPQ